MYLDGVEHQLEIYASSQFEHRPSGHAQGSLVPWAAINNVLYILLHIWRLKKKKKKTRSTEKVFGGACAFRLVSGRPKKGVEGNPGGGLSGEHCGHVAISIVIPHVCVQDLRVCNRGGCGHPVYISLLYICTASIRSQPRCIFFPFSFRLFWGDPVCRCISVTSKKR